MQHRFTNGTLFFAYIRIGYLFLTKFSHDNFPFHVSMPCTQVNCVKWLTVMVLKNQTRRLEQFLAPLDKSHAIDPYLVVPFASLQRFVRLSQKDEKDIVQFEEYLLLNPTEPHLSFDELSSALLDPNQPLEYQVRPFLPVIFQCKNMYPDLLSMSITTDSFNTLVMHHEIWRV